ncbi:hypothetical protein FHP05_10220 [Cerasibacillus terrae]|uniref:Uncharacterized protein n=1 Tax=Cerasibacillus terrae TaxID=2498845 RepID=A0A5C8NQN4_9BACI|nr:hypothetical protein [Cerasibacillus terrae]TXL64054.1 hypothetical protein FHP05_10220 [Cerasibacillus terrae]
MNRFEGINSNKNDITKYGSSNNQFAGLSRGELLGLIGGFTTIVGDSIALYGALASIMEAKQADQQQQQEQQQMQNQIDQLQQQLQQQKQDQQQKEKDFQQQMDQLNQWQQEQQKNQEMDLIDIFQSSNQTNLPLSNGTYKQDTEMKQQILELQKQMCITQQNQEDQLKLLRELLQEFKNEKKSN